MNENKIRIHIQSKIKLATRFIYPTFYLLILQTNVSLLCNVPECKVKVSSLFSLKRQIEYSWLVLPLTQEFNSEIDLKYSPIFVCFILLIKKKKSEDKDILFTFVGICLSAKRQF